MDNLYLNYGLQVARYPLLGFSRLLKYQQMVSKLVVACNEGLLVPLLATHGKASQTLLLYDTVAVSSKL